MSTAAQQIPLALDLGPRHLFSEFEPGPNALARQAVQDAADIRQSPWPLLWGASGTGKTHLLAACVSRATDIGRTALYVSGSMLKSHSAEYLEALEAFDVLAVDDLDVLVGDPEWDRALFSLYNRIKSEGGVLVTSTAVALSSLSPTLPDLKSRLAWGSGFQLNSLSDEEKVRVLTRRAELMGYEMSSEVSRYLMRHHSRNLKKLVQLLRELETATLSAKRRLTVAFLKTYLQTKRNTEQTNDTQPG